MDAHDIALASAGIIGSGVALVHGRLTERLIVAPYRELAATRMPGAIRRLVPALLHFSTFNWFVGGLALLVAASALGQEARLAIGLVVGSAYLYGTIGNLWATRGRHPGWIFYGVAVLLIGYGIAGSGT
jgi:hypothetical protein